MSTRLASRFALAILASSCVEQQMILPGILNLPVMEGGRLARDCWEPQDSVGGDYHQDCVVLPREGASAKLDDYARQVADLGYVTGGAAGSGLWADRVTSADCVQRIFIFASDYPPRDFDSDQVSLTFLAERQARCGADRAPPV